MTTTAGRPANTKANTNRYRVLGTRPVRHDGVDKVTGHARYGADVHFPGMLHAKVLRSPHAHARIRAIDTSAAEALAGVKAIVTADDLPITQNARLDFGESGSNVRIVAENLLAHDKVLYKGHAVAAVAATSPHVAEEAVGLIQVDYDVLPPVLSVREAMKPGAPLVHENLTTYFTVERFAKGQDTGEKSNVASHLQLKRGDLEQGFEEADIIVEREFTTAPVHQGYIEPHASTVAWGKDGRITVWTSTQSTFGVRGITAAVLGVQESSVKVIPMEIGGGFGAKLATYLDPVAAILSKKTGKPVKAVMSRQEVFEGTGPTSGTYMRCKIGANKEGRITAAELFLAFEAGAFPGSPVGGAVTCALGPYKLDNMVVDGYDVIVNKQKVAAYRAPGMPQGAFAVEPVIDELAEKLAMDPLELRLKNAVQEGDRTPSGVPHPVIGLIEVEEAMKDHPHYKAPLEGPNRGRGVALAYRINTSMVSCATLNVNDDGTVEVVTGAVDIGGGRTSIAMQVAETLGLAAEEVVPTVVDTDSVGYTGGTAGSRTTFDTGLAAIAAAEQIKGKMAHRAAMIWEVQPEDVELQGGVFLNKKNPDERLSFKQLAGRLRATGGPLTASAASEAAAVGPVFGGNIVDVEVDPETGKVDILRCTGFMDAGTAVHPSYVEGQLQGGTVQGIGWALNEEYFFTPDGAMANPTWLDYRTPTSLDVPMIETVLLEVPNPRHPFGLRGVGEIPLVPPMAALANAIYRAVGVRMDRLPMNPGAVLEAIEAGQSEAGAI